MVLETAGAKRLTQVMLMHILGFGIVSSASVPRRRHSISARESGAGQMGSRLCPPLAFLCAWADRCCRSLSRIPIPAKEPTVSPPGED